MRSSAGGVRSATVDHKAGSGSDWATVGEGALIAGICRHRPEALAELYERLGPQCLIVAGHVAGAEQAGRIVREVFLCMWHQRDSLDLGPGSLRTTVLLKVYESAVTQCRGSDDRRLVHRAGESLSRLPDLEREAIVLAHFGGCALGEIAVALELSVSAAGGYIRSGLRRIRADHR